MTPSGFGELRIKNVTGYKLKNNENQVIEKNYFTGNPKEKMDAIITKWVCSQYDDYSYDDLTIESEPALLVFQTCAQQHGGAQYQELGKKGSRLLAKNGPGNCLDKKLYFDLDECLKNKDIEALDIINTDF